MQKPHTTCVGVHGIGTIKAIICMISMHEAHGPIANSCYASLTMHAAHEPDAKSIVFFILRVISILDMSLGLVTNFSKVVLSLNFHCV